MQPIYSWAWTEEHAARTANVWNACSSRAPQTEERFTISEQQKREKAYDQGLQAVERAIKTVPVTSADRLATQDRITTAFARFSATALGLEDEAIHALTNDFLPVGTGLMRWARQFDENLTMPEIIQACRNAWTACGLQPLLGLPVKLTPSILGYSLLYPYSDNFLDREEVSPDAKLRFSQRFRRRLSGEQLLSSNHRERALWTLIGLIEEEYPRELCPQVFDSLLAIHRAQEESITQLGTLHDSSPAEILRVSCAKGGSSVVADACLAQCCLSAEENLFAFEWGVLLQLGDDLQDLRDDLRRNSVTLFSRAATLGQPLDSLAIQLLNFGVQVGSRMDRLPNGTTSLKDLLKMSWRSLIVRAVADSHEFFTPAFIREAEQWSPFRFDFLRTRHDKLANKQGLYAMLFDAFLESRECDRESMLLVR